MAVEHGLTQDWAAPSMNELRQMGQLTQPAPMAPVTVIASDAMRHVMRPRPGESWAAWRCRVDREMVALAESTAFADRPNL